MKLGSLCSGAGGLDMAVEAVFGAKTVWHCELDAAASKVLAHRWPGVPNYRDLTAMGWTGVEPIDILCAGWPCQPFSLAGKQKGADDERAIWPEIARAIRVLRPRIIVLENVSAVLRSEFQRVADSLAALGYDLRWTCLRASDVGAPHRRERLFIVATDTSRNGWHEGWPESARLVGGSDAALGGHGAVDLLPTPRSSDCFGAGVHGEGGMDLRTTISLLPTPKTHLRGDCTSERKRNDPDLPAVTHHFPEGQWGKYEPAIRRWEAVTRPAPSPTEPNKNGNPRLSAAFSEWLMGWPAGWVTDLVLPMSDPRPNKLSRNDALRIIGNGVVPQSAAAALTYLLSLSAVA